MPRLRAPKKIEIPNDVLDNEPPTDDIVIELGDDELDLPMDALEPEGEISSPAPAPAPAPEPSPEDALQRALEAQQRAEELARLAQEREREAVRRATEREAELRREREERGDAEYNSILTGIAAEKSALAKAKSDYETAASAADWRAASEAQQEIAVATSRLDRLELSKSSFDQARDTRAQQPQRSEPAPQGLEEQLAAMPITDEARAWLRSHPEFVNDRAKNERLGVVHRYVTEFENIPPFSKAYFEALDTRLGLKPAPAAPAPAPAPAPQPQARRSMPVTAPVSREATTPSGERPSSSSITLSAEERFIARTSFTDPTGKMTNAEKERLYAMNKARLARERAAGRYPARERA